MRPQAFLAPVALGVLVALVVTLGVMMVSSGGGPIVGIVAGIAAGAAFAARQRKRSLQA